jgi:hypothetical protein
VAELAAVVKGYGEVRRRLSGALARCLDETVRPAIEADRLAGEGFARATGIVRESREALLSEEPPRNPPAGEAVGNDHPLPPGEAGQDHPLPSGEAAGQDHPLPSGERAG